METIKTFLQNLTIKQKIAYGIILGAILVAIVYYVALLSWRSTKLAVTVKVAPYTAEVKLDGRTLKNNAVNYLDPGTYTLTATLEHFADLSEEIEITEGQPIILFAMTANDEEGDRIVALRSGDFLDFEGESGKILQESGAEYRAKYPILNKLPYNLDQFSVSYYSVEPLGEPTIRIEAKNAMLNPAVAALKNVSDETGDSFARYKLVFEENDNIFATPQRESDEIRPAEKLSEMYDCAGSGHQFASGRRVDNYYVGAITMFDDYDGHLSATYRFILKSKDDGGWELATTPMPLYSHQNDDEIPNNVVDAANALE